MITIERRKFLKGVGGLAAAAAINPLALGREQKRSVGVVGGGIVGASIALHLAGLGAIDARTCWFAPIPTASSFCKMARW